MVTLHGFFNFITVNTGGVYSPDYVNRMWAMAQRYINVPMEPYCITENPSGIHRDIHILRPHGHFPKYWSKMHLYSPWMPHGAILYMDLDQIIMRDITADLEVCTGPFSCYADHTSWYGAKIGSALMVFESRSLLNIWEDFNKEPETIYNLNGGDQAYLSRYLKNVDYINERSHNFAASYKLDIVEKGLNPEDFSIINFHGRPKPHELVEEEKWIQQWWR